MNELSRALPVVVGVDGSKYALRAAIWAATEAADRDVALRLAYVVDGAAEPGGHGCAEAEQALHAVWMAVERSVEGVKLESVVLRGDAAEELIEASRQAQLVCVGARGRNDSRSEDRGSTAAALAQKAFAPVAIVRRRHTRRPLPPGRWIVAALDDASGSSLVLQTALKEAELREAPVLALTRWATASEDEADLRRHLTHYLAEDGDDNASIQMCALPVSDHISNVLSQSASIDQLVIVDSSDPALVAEVVGPEARKTLRHTNCSVLVLRRPTEGLR